jgi:predicted amidohydrolase
MASKHNVLFVGTWIVREGDRCFNRLHWVLPDGTYGFYDKAHTFRPSGEHDIISRGTCRMVFEYKGWRIKPAVCYDLRFPKWLRNDGLDYDLLLVCANWPASRREAWTTLLRARAIENLCYVVGCNRTGIDGVGGEYSGDSAIVDYKGFSMPVGTADGSLCLTATLDRQRLDSFRQKWPLYLDFD